MGLISSINKANFEDVQYATKNKRNCIIMNTLSSDEQDLLILNTLDAKKEEEVINNYLKKNKNIKIIIYGKNCYEEKILSKYNQLIKLGFTHVYLYLGGLFEWILLQEIYGFDEFPTNIKNNCIDILKYKSISNIID